MTIAAGRCPLILGLGLGLAACSLPARPVAEPATTVAGDRGGYSVVHDCQDPSLVGVIGRGQRWFDGVDPLGQGRPLALERFGLEVVIPEIQALPSFTAADVGPACHGIGVRVLVSDWREVDPAVDRLGALLHAHDLREEIAVGVAPSASAPAR
jgi:hypothetical protein